MTQVRVSTWLERETRRVTWERAHGTPVDPAWEATIGSSCQQWIYVHSGGGYISCAAWWNSDTAGRGEREADEEAEGAHEKRQRKKKKRKKKKRRARSEREKENRWVASARSSLLVKLILLPCFSLSLVVLTVEWLVLRCLRSFFHSFFLLSSKPMACCSFYPLHESSCISLSLEQAANSLQLKQLSTTTAITTLSSLPFNNYFFFFCLFSLFNQLCLAHSTYCAIDIRYFNFACFTDC